MTIVNPGSVSLTVSRDVADSRILFRAGSLECQRAPAFDHIERDALLAIVGITPGAVQQANADRAGQPDPQAADAAETARKAKFAASFSGELRPNLVGMLDHVGAHRALGIASCSEIFDPSRRGLVHFTSALRHPVFVNGRNYNGSPNMVRTPALRAMIESYLADEVLKLPKAHWLPLGPKPLAALHHLVSLGILSAERVLPPLPHPSGQNSERIKFFMGRKPRESLSAKTPPGPIERNRQALRRHFSEQAIRLGRLPA